MNEVESGQPESPVLPRDAKTMLRSAREASGLTLAEIAARTRVPLRHLEAIEAGDYTSLPSPTYAVGFARAHARATGADDVEIARQVRVELDRIGPRTPEYVPYETADPTRVPSRGIAILGAGIALAVLVLVGLYYGTSLFRGGVATDAPAAQVAATPVPVKPVAAPAPPTGGQVSLVATDEVWLRVYDADNKTLYLGTMKAGDRFDVPAAANDPMINVGRPDKLQVTLNGSSVPPLGTGERAIKDVRVSGPAIAARLNGTAAPAADTPRAGANSATTTRTTARTSQPVPTATTDQPRTGGDGSQAAGNATN